MYTKQELRKLIAERKKKYDPIIKLQKSRYIFNQISVLEEFIQAKTILCYWSMPDEVCTHDFIVEHANTKQFFLPAIYGDNLLIRKFNGVESLTKGTLSIMEPNNSENASLSKIELVIVPGIAFDAEGRRLGRGKGYYDRLLAESDVLKIGVCFDYQIIDQIPCNQYDIKMNKVIYG